MTISLRKRLDWGKFGPLRLRAKSVADGVYAGTHRSPRRGAGIEFGGHRSYVQGDDLRFIDRHALMRHGQLLIREFETETDRDLRLIVDASASMSFRSSGASGPKFAFAALIAAALAKIAVASGDRVALDFIAGEQALGFPRPEAAMPSSASSLCSKPPNPPAKCTTTFPRSSGLSPRARATAEEAASSSCSAI